MPACVHACVATYMHTRTSQPSPRQFGPTQANPNQLSPTQPNPAQPDPTHPRSTETNPTEPNPTQSCPNQRHQTRPPPTQARSSRTNARIIDLKIVWEADRLGVRLIDPANNYPSIRLEFRSTTSSLPPDQLQAGLSFARRFHANEPAERKAKDTATHLWFGRAGECKKPHPTQQRAIQKGWPRTAPRVYKNLGFELNVIGGSIGTVPGRHHALGQV